MRSLIIVNRIIARRCKEEVIVLARHLYGIIERLREASAAPTVVADARAVLPGILDRLDGPR